MLNRGDTNSDLTVFTDYHIRCNKNCHLKLVSILIFLMLDPKVKVTLRSRSKFADQCEDF